MVEPAFDISELPDQGSAEPEINLDDLPDKGDPDEDLKTFVRGYTGTHAVELRQDEAPSFIKRLWRTLTEPTWEKRKAQSAISMQLAKEGDIRPSKTEPPGLFEIGRQGFRQSAWGLANRLAYDDKDYETISNEAFKRMNTAQRVVFQSAMLAGDFPYMIAGAAVGAPAGPAGAIGGAFAFPAGLRKLYADKLEKGEVVSFRDFWERLTGAVYETLKGEAVGVATGAIGLRAGVAKLPAEIVTMVSVGAALEGKMPEPKEFLDAAIVIGGLHASQRVQPILYDIFRKTGKEPAQIIKDMQSDPSIKKDILRAAEEKPAEAVKPEKPVSEKTIPESYKHLEEKPISEGDATLPTRQRKFLKTVEESEQSNPELVERVKEVDPQEYIVQPNTESLAKAETRIEKTGLDATVDFVLSDAELSAEKGATFITLMDRFQKAGDYDRTLQMVEAYDMQLREAGRFVQAASIWNKLSPIGFIRWAEKQLAATQSKYSWLDTIFRRKPKDFSLTQEEKQSIMERMSKIQMMPDGIEKTDAILGIIDEVAQKVPPSVSEIIDAYRYQNMLSSPRTQMRNIGENIANTFITRPYDLTIKGGMDYFKASMFGKERQAYVNDVPLYMKTAINAVPNALNGFMAVWRLERGVEVGKPEIGIEIRSEFQRARVKQLPKTLTIVSRFMEASDHFNSALIGAGEFAIQKKRGATDAEAYKRSSELAQKYLYRDQLKPSDPDLAYFSKVLSSLGKMVNDSRNLPGLGPIMKWFVPFIRTPTNKGIQMIERSPLGLFRGKITSDSTARIAGGTILTGIGALFALQGLTTWTAPSDQREKEWFYESGRKPFSVKIGDNWVPLWYLGPFALAFGLPAAVKHYTQDEKTALTKDYAQKLLAIAEGSARFIGSQSSTQSIGAMFSALSGDLDYTFPSSVAFTAGQVIPAQSLIRYINGMVDPVYRKPETFFEEFLKDIPIFSKGLEPRMTPFMEEAKREPLNYFTPYDIGKAKPEAEAGYASIRFDIRQQYLQNKINALNRWANEKAAKGRPVDPDKMFKKLQRIFYGMDENVRQLEARQ